MTIRRLDRRYFLISLGSMSMLVACSPGGTTPGVLPTSTPSTTPTATPTIGPTATPTPTAAPTIPPNSVAMPLVNANPSLTSSSINVYVFGQDTGGNWQYLKSDWTLAPWAQTAPFPGIPFYAGGTGSGNTSQPFYLPKLISARIYISGAPLSFSTNSGPTPWTNDGSQTVTYDSIEYTFDGGGFHTNTTAVSNQ